MTPGHGMITPDVYTRSSLNTTLSLYEISFSERISLSQFSFLKSSFSSLVRSIYYEFISF